MQLDKATIILTGAASGIGRALLTQLAAHPCRLLAVDIHPEGLQAAIEGIPNPIAQIIPYIADLSQQTAIDDLFTHAIDQLGNIDLFIANAGFAYYELLEQPDWDRLDLLYRLNVYSPIYSAVKMRQLYGSKPYKVVMVASTMGHLAIPGYALYGATKAALHRFADGYRLELDDPRKLMLVYPIATRTAFFRHASDATLPHTPFPSQTPDYVAGKIIQGIKRDQKSVYPSYAFAMLSLMERFIPPLRRIPQLIEGYHLRQWIKAPRR